MPAQDDEELFDLYAEDGSPLGVTKARGLVHRDGDWHRSLHVWVVLREPGRGPRVLLQRRSAGKDTWPRAVDVSVAGHYQAGESLEDALRESEEEIGLALTLADVDRLGLRVRGDRGEGGGRDNELQDIFVAFTARPLESLRPSPDEVEALYAVPLADLSLLVSGGAPSVAAEGIAPGSSVVAEARVSREELIPTPDGYFEAAVASIAALLAGQSRPAFVLGR